jgi:hypothetical protein
LSGVNDLDPFHAGVAMMQSRTTWIAFDEAGLGELWLHAELLQCPKSKSRNNRRTRITPSALVCSALGLSHDLRYLDADQTRISPLANQFKLKRSDSVIHQRLGDS